MTMPKKPKRQTRERILETALRLFNRDGEPSVTTSAIAAEIGISHGNLYYHYPCKEKIVEDLFAGFCEEMGRTLAAPERRPPHVEDVWLFLHLLFETIFKYRFLYRDLNELLWRHRAVETGFKRILAQECATASSMLRGLVASGQLSASSVEIEALAESMTLVATYWLSYEFARHPRSPQNATTLARGVFHVMSLAAPHMNAQARALFDHLARRYLNSGANGHGEKIREMDWLSSPRQGL